MKREKTSWPSLHKVSGFGAEKHTAYQGGRSGRRRFILDPPNLGRTTANRRKPGLDTPSIYRHISQLDDWTSAANFRLRDYLRSVPPSNSKVVSRKALNRIAEKMGISKWMSNSRRGGRGGHTSVPGNTLEALVGAVYADRGWKATRTFVFKHMIEKHVNINSVEREIVSYKSLLIEWVQKNKKRFDFVLQDEEGSQHRKRFVFKLLIDDKAVSEGSGPSKKTAEEAASKAACYELNIHRRGNKPSRSRRPQRKRPS